MGKVAGRFRRPLPPALPRLAPAGYFALRTPALSWIEIERWGEGLLAAGAGADGPGIEDRVRRDADLLRQRLREIVTRPCVREAVFVASPGLHARLDRWLAGADAPDVEAAAVRYVMRMAGRATPFGLFAGVGIGDLGARTQLAVSSLSAQARCSRLDMEYLLFLAEDLANDGVLRAELRYRTVSELYEFDGRIRYCEVNRSGRRRAYRLVEADATPELVAALAFARQEGGVTLDELARHLCGAFPVPIADAAAYVASLVDARLLRSSLDLRVTGASPAQSLAEELGRTAAGRRAGRALKRAMGELAAADAGGPVEGVCSYERVLADLAGRRPGSAPALHVDLHKPHPGLTLSTAVADEIARAVELLMGFNRPRPREIDRFAREFARRYQEREVPLLEALDEETGVPFGGPSSSRVRAPLLAGLELPPPDERAAQSWTAQADVLLRRLNETVSAGEVELRLTDKDVGHLTQEPRVVSMVRCCAVASIAAASADAIDRGDYRVVVDRVVGRSAGVLLARFSTGDSALLARLRGTLQEEEECIDRDAIHAEIAHLPQGRAGNVVARPLLRRYEIDLFRASGASDKRRITLDDLLVSVRSGEVRLRSRRRGARVVPHLTCAHAFRREGLGIYRFLAAVAEGTATDIDFPWGPLASAPFLPRVAVGRAVLSLARWNLGVEEFRPLCASRGGARFAAAQCLKARLRLPRFVRLRDGDNALPVDLDNALSVEGLARLVGRRRAATLSEMFPTPEQLPAAGDEGRFIHELVVPFVRTLGDPPRHRERHVVGPIAVRPCRAKRPGEEWLFVKLYCGPSDVDRLLTEVVAPIVIELRGRSAIDRWHFVRYADPDWHLRLRLRGDRALQDVAPDLLERTNRLRRLVFRTVIDTYDAEEERYGGQEGMDLAERIFEVDSEAAISIVARCGGDPDARWRLALLGMDALLDDFGLDGDSKQRVVDACWRRQMARYGSKAVRWQVGAKYRLFRAELEAMLVDPPPGYAPQLAAIAARSQAVAQVLPRLTELEEGGRLLRPVASIVASHLHMWANRVFADSANAQELVLYDFLRRLNRTRLARQAAEQRGQEEEPTDHRVREILRAFLDHT